MGPLAEPCLGPCALPDVAAWRHCVTLPGTGPAAFVGQNLSCVQHKYCTTANGRLMSAQGRLQGLRPQGQNRSGHRQLWTVVSDTWAQARCWTRAAVRGVRPSGLSAWSGKGCESTHGRRAGKPLWVHHPSFVIFVKVVRLHTMHINKAS